MNASKPDEVAAARLRAKDRSGRDADDLKAVLSTIEGRRFIWSVLKSCKLYESPLNGNGGFQSANIGRGDVGRELLHRLNQADPTAYPKMMIEMAGE